MCRVLREGPVLCLNQCVFGVDMRSDVSAMCFLVGFVCALVFKSVMTCGDIIFPSIDGNVHVP